MLRYDMMHYSPSRYSMLRYDMMCCDTICSVILWYDVCYGLLYYSVSCCIMIRCNMQWHDMFQYKMIRYAMMQQFVTIKCDMIQCIATWYDDTVQFLNLCYNMIQYIYMIWCHVTILMILYTCVMIGLWLCTVALNYVTVRYDTIQ